MANAVFEIGGVANGTWVLQGFPGAILHSINFNPGAAASTLTLYDNLLATGPPLAVITSASYVNAIFDAQLQKGLVATISGAGSNATIVLT